ncbi:MAG: hypothetical protein METHP_00784 [Methanoregula sp. SKADARSKE-2]|nr:MAG: hypothetical protein METHP_00784 [Methanoregula sp. SKADARSKE-2]
MNGIKGFLIDLDGVMYIGDREIPGAVEMLRILNKKGYAFRFVSNTTRKSRRTIAERLLKMGFEIPENTIFTPPIAAIAYMMKKRGKNRCSLLVTGDAVSEFEDVCTGQPAEDVDFVIIGDAGEKITYESMNAAFRSLMNGAELIALERDRYWMAADGLSLSAGPFVSALEYATGKTAVVVGKPSKDFFALALEEMGLEPEEVAMIGDDISTDIGGSQETGMTGILVRTGKFREEVLERSGVKPDHIIDSIADLGIWLLPIPSLQNRP